MVVLLTPRISYELIRGEGVEYRGLPDHPPFTLLILTLSHSISLGYLLPWGIATLRDSLGFLATQRSRLSLTSSIHPQRLITTTDLDFRYRELAINPPVISFSSLRNFDWGPVTIPIQIDGRTQSQNDFKFLLPRDCSVVLV